MKRTILKLDPTHPVTQKAVADVHLMHRHVMDGFTQHLPGVDLFAQVDSGHATSRADQQILFAVDHRPNNEVWVMVQSRHEGDWEGERVAEAMVEKPRTHDVVLPTSGNVRYQLVANPTKKQSKTGKLVGLTAPDAVEAWWRRKAAEAGLDVEGARVDVSRGEVLRPHSLNPDRREFSICTARITGAGSVVDADLFEASCTSGVGRSAAYGCGMLLALPA